MFCPEEEGRGVFRHIGTCLANCDLHIPQASNVHLSPLRNEVSNREYKCPSFRGARIPVAKAAEFSTLAPSISEWVLSLDLAPCHHSGAYSLDAASGIFERLVNPCHHRQGNGSMYLHVSRIGYSFPCDIGVGNTVVALVLSHLTEISLHCTLAYVCCRWKRDRLRHNCSCCRPVL